MLGRADGGGREVEDFLIGLEVCGDTLRAEAVGGTSGGLGHGARLFLVSGGSDDGVGEGEGVSDGDDGAGFAVVDEVGDACDGS